MKLNRALIAGMSVIVLGGFLWQTDRASAQETQQMAQPNAAGKVSMTEKQAADAAGEWMKKVSYVQSGGSYESGEYKTFSYKNKTYRYLSKDIDTKKELLNYLTKSVTVSYAEKYIKQQGIIQHKGKLAQAEADGGSLLQWNQAQAVFEKKAGKELVYKVVVPVGETKERSIYKVHMLYQPKQGWKINKCLFVKDISFDIPFNLNPAFNFFKFLLVNPSESEAQLINKHVLDVNAFKNGITNVEVRTLKENAITADQVEYSVTVDVKLSEGYKGSLKSGENQLFFLIENTGYMEFKIVSISTQSRQK